MADLVGFKTVNSTSVVGSGDIAVQATLVSGTNIKTINSTSLLGSGNIALGGDVSKVGTPANDQVGVWTGDGTIEGTSGLTYSATAGLGITITGNLTRSVALTLRNTTDTSVGSDPSDYMDEVHLVFQTGTAANHRRYINFKQYDGTDQWLWGVNAGGAVIMYDSSSGHRMHMLEGGVTQLNSIGADAVEINNYPGSDTLGTGGLTIYSGGASGGRYKRCTIGESNTDHVQVKGQVWWGGTDSTGNGRLNSSGSDAYVDAINGDLYLRTTNGSTQALRLSTTESTFSTLVKFTGTSHAGLRLNSLTTTQRDALTAANGDIVYNSTTSAINAYVGGSWTAIGSGGATPAGSGTELQFRSSGSAFGALTDSSVSGNALTLGGTLAIRNGTTGQTVEVYNTYSSGGGNYERAALKWDTNTFGIGMEKAGTGLDRLMWLVSKPTTATCSVSIRSKTNDNDILQLYPENQSVNLKLGYNDIRCSGSMTVGTNGGALSLFTTGVVRQTIESDGTVIFAGNLIELRNGTTGQTFNVYNTYSGGGSNYERGVMKWSSNILQIGTENAGTGSQRSVKVQFQDSNCYADYDSGTNGIRIASYTALGFYLTAGGYYALACDLFNGVKLRTPSLTVRNGADSAFSPVSCSDITLRPSASLTPSANGDLAIEATSNTSITFKYKGSDGTVRSGSITLS